MAYPNQKDSAWYLVGEKNELEKSRSRKIARFRRNSRVIPGFFSFLINKVGPGHLLKFFTKDVSPEVWRAAFSGSLWAWMVWAGLGFVSLFLLHTKDTHWLRMWRPSCSSCALMFRFRARMVWAACNNTIIKTQLNQQNKLFLLPKKSSNSADWFILYSTLPVLQLELASVNSSPGVVAYTALWAGWAYCWDCTVGTHCLPLWNYSQLYVYTEERNTWFKFVW